MRFKTSFHFIPPIIPPAFGLDISDSSAKYAQLAKTSKGLAVSAFGEIKLPQDLVVRGVIKDMDGLSGILKKEFSKKKSKLARHVVVSIPDENVFLTKLTLPVLPEGELSNAVRVEVERNVPISVEKAYLDYVVMPRTKTDNKLEVLAVAIQRDVADTYAETVQKTGLEPIVIEPEVSAISRAAIEGGRSKKSLIIIEIGVNRTRLIVFYRNHVILTGSANFSAGYINEKIAEVLGIDEKEAYKLKWTKGALDHQKKSKDAQIMLKKELGAFAQEVGNYIDSIDSQHKPEKVILSGGGAHIPDISENLKDVLGVNVEKVNPLVNIVGASKSAIPRLKANRYTAALGLAIRGAESSII